MLEQNPTTMATPNVQRLVEQVQASRLLMRERVREVASAEPAAGGLHPSSHLGPLYRVFADLRD